VGFLSPNASIGFLGQIQRAAVAETQRLGGKVIAKDAGFDPGRQVSQFQDLLAQRVDAIISYPVVPQTLGPAVREAQHQKVPVITQDTPPDPGEPLLPGYATEVLQARDRADYEIAKALARQAPGSTYALLGNAQPVPLLQFAIQRARYWADRFGLKFAGRVDQTTDTADAAQKAMTAILSQHPDVDNVITYTDNSAAAAAQVARASGKADIRVAGVGGDATAFKLIKAGILWGTYAQNAAEIGRQMAIAAYANVTGQGARLPKKITVTGGQLVTKDNVDSAKPSTPA
jgi:ABC-type sugar transport system substrate-binding protein